MFNVDFPLCVHVHIFILHVFSFLFFLVLVLNMCFLLLSMQGSFGFLPEGDRAKATEDYILQVTTSSMMLFIE